MYPIHEVGMRRGMRCIDSATLAQCCQCQCGRRSPKSKVESDQTESPSPCLLSRITRCTASGSSNPANAAAVTSSDRVARVARCSLFLPYYLPRSRPNPWNFVLLRQSAASSHRLDGSVPILQGSVRHKRCPSMARRSKASRFLPEPETYFTSPCLPAGTRILLIFSRQEAPEALALTPNSHSARIPLLDTDAYLLAKPNESAMIQILALG